MNVDVQQLQKYRSTLKKYRKKIKQMEDIEQPNRKEKHEKNNEINQIYKHKMKLIIKKIEGIKISFSSAKRRIKDLSSIISDYGFIIDFFDNIKYSPIELSKDRSPTKINISTMKELLEKKEKRYASKLDYLKKEKIALKEKQTQLSVKKNEIEKRYEKIFSLMNANSENTDFLEQVSNQLDNQIKYVSLVNQNTESNNYIDNNESFDIDENEFDQQKDLIDQQLQIQEQQLNELIMKNQIRKERIESKSAEIRLLKKTYLSNPIKINTNFQNIASQKQQSDHDYEYEQEYASDNYFEEEQQEQYDQLISMQKKIDEENRSIDLLIAQNNQIRSQTEEDYEKKLKTITQLSDQSSEIDKLIISIHKMNDEIIESNEQLSQLDLTKKRIMRQNANITKSIEKLKDDQEELKKREFEANSKKKIVDEQEANLRNHLSQYEEDLAFVDNQINELNDKKSEVEKLEYQISCLEEKVEEANEEIKRLTDLVDKLLLNASSTRADSRINRLQEIIDSNSEVEVDANTASENAFYHKFMKSSTNNSSFPK